MIDVSKLSPEALLPRVACAEALTQRGYPVRPKTLSTKASRGGGPPYHRFGNRVLYRWSDLGLGGITPEPLCALVFRG
jgi:hypothetical protein